MDGPKRLVQLVGKGDATIGEVLAARVAATPASPFIERGGRRWSYAEAWAECRCFAGFLAAQGLIGVRVATFLPKCPQAIFTWFGTAIARGVYVAVNHAHRGAVLRDLLERSRAGLLVTDLAGWETVGPLLPKSVARVLFIDHVPAALSAAVHAFDWRCVTDSEQAEALPCRPGELATLLYTSGTTGRSKAVLLPHNMYCRGGARLAEAFGYRSDDRFHDWMPLSHIGGQLHVTMTAIIAGACLVQYPVFSRHSFWEEVRAAGATVFSGFASILSLLMETPPSPDDRRHGLRIGLIGNMPATTHTAFERRFGVTLLDTYGMSECEPLTLPRAGETPPGSCGRVCPDFEIRILDEDDNPLPVGETGRICVRPRVPHVMMQGYEGDPEAAVNAWRNLWFHTTDRGRFDGDGFLYFVDRMKYAIRRGGENVSPSDVEQVFLAHPDIVACAAFGIPDPIMGEEVKAILVCRPGAPGDPAEYHRYAVERIEITSDLPYTEVGKLKREDLLRSSGETWDARRAG